MCSLAAFVYTSADCVLDYISQQYGNHGNEIQFRGNHGDQADDVISLPAFTVCNLNPLRSAHIYPLRQNWQMGQKCPSNEEQDELAYK